MARLIDVLCGKRANPDCDWCHGLGWTLAHAIGGSERVTDESIAHVQRCDDCAVYESDAEAGLAAVQRLIEYRRALAGIANPAAVPSLLEALDNLVGTGAPDERTCNLAEHGPDEDSECAWCQARAVLAQAFGTG